MSALDRLVGLFLASQKGRYVNALTIHESEDGRVQITICNGSFVHHAMSVGDDVEEAARDLYEKVADSLPAKSKRRKLFDD